MSYQPFIDKQSAGLTRLHDPLAPEQTVDFDYDQIDRHLGNETKGPEESASLVADALRRIVSWVVGVKIESADAERQIARRTLAAAKHFGIAQAEQLIATVDQPRKGNQIRRQPTATNS
jgi:hypothetical protein